MASLSLFLSILISAVALTAAATMLVYRWLNRRGASSGKRGGQAARKRSASDKRRSRGGSRSPKTTTKSASKQGATGPRVAFPRLPAWLRAALPLGMMLTLIAGSGQLALQGIDNAHRGGRPLTVGIGVPAGGDRRMACPSSMKRDTWIGAFAAPCYSPRHHMQMTLAT